MTKTQSKTEVSEASSNSAELAAINLQGATILLHGTPKVGKTQLASSFPGPVVFLCTEWNHKWIPQEQQEIMVQLDRGPYGWTKFLATGERLASAKIRPKTVVIDTLQNLFESCALHVAEENKWVDIESKGMAGWRSAKKEFWKVRRWLDHVRSVGATCIGIAHSQMETIEHRAIKYNRVGIDLGKSVGEVFLQEANHIWHYAHGVQRDRSNLNAMTGPRTLWVSGTDEIVAGTQDPNVVRTCIEDVPKTGQYDYIVRNLYEAGPAR